LNHVPYWNFTDWVTNSQGWSGGVAPIGLNGNSAILDLQLLWAYQIASEMEDHLGIKAYTGIYLDRAKRLTQTIWQKYWDEKKGLFADTQEKGIYSQHANTLAILTGLITDSAATHTAQTMLSDTSLTPASIYFKYYLHSALIKSGLGNDYLNWLGKWYENIDMGLTTWAEDSEINTARSDCHAWGASPNIEFYRTVLGIDSDAPGFSRVKIEPHLGDLKNVSGEIPHPLGKVAVKYISEKGKWNVSVSLPTGLSGSLIWKGQQFDIKEGANNFTL
jgi:hypothetical protein